MTNARRHLPLVAAVVAVAAAFAVLAPRQAAPAIKAPAVHVAPVPASVVAMAKTLPGGMAELVELMKELTIALAPNSPIARQVAADQQRKQTQKVCHKTVVRGYYVQWPNPSTDNPEGVRLYSQGNVAVSFTTKAAAAQTLAKLKQQAGC